MGHGYTQDQYIDSESIKTVPDKHHPQVACKAKPRTCHSNTTTAFMGHDYTQDQHIDSENIKTDPETHHPQDTCKAGSRTRHTNTKC